MVRIIENSVEIQAPVEEVFRFLASPENVSIFAPGIEEAVLARGESGTEGASLALTTRSGRHIGAQVVWLRENVGWAVADAHGTQNGWEFEDLGNGRTRATNSIRGNWPDAVADKVEAEAREKVQALAALVPRVVPTL